MSCYFLGLFCNPFFMMLYWYSIIVPLLLVVVCSSLWFLLHTTTHKSSSTLRVQSPAEIDPESLANPCDESTMHCRLSVAAIAIP